MTDETISKVAADLRMSASRSESEIRQNLMQDGLSRAEATRLVEFIPMAFCRLLLASSGVRFADTFRRRLADGGMSEEKLLASEPIWNAVMKYAEDEMMRGITRPDVLAIAMRSAEFDAVNQLLNGGSELKNVILTPVVLLEADLNEE